jgi:hypothetical protein
VSIRDNGRLLSIAAVPTIGLGFLIATVVRSSGGHHGGTVAGYALFGAWVALGMVMVVGAWRGATRIYADHIEVYPYPLPFGKRSYPLADLAGVGLYEVQHLVSTGRGGSDLTYEWQLVLWYASGSTTLLKSVESDRNLRSHDVTEEFAQGDPILKTKAGRIAQAVYQQALALQGPQGELSKAAFPADDVEQSLGRPIARWTPYAGFKALSDNPDVQAYYPGAVAESPGEAARRKERGRHAVELAIGAVVVVLGFLVLSHVSIGTSTTTADPTVARWFNHTVNPDLVRINNDTAVWTAASQHAPTSARAARACSRGYADAQRFSTSAPAPPLATAWQSLDGAYIAYFAACTEVTQARTPKARRLAASDMEMRQVDINLSYDQFHTVAQNYGFG